ncbi:MAG: Rpn family recombination-promoting nuclease/putative transposase [Symploca sp. SIO2G7]|nr:Rpn family recombination-promoting nuclease/putative transposase [Symploca sp. SIO2G7]
MPYPLQDRYVDLLTDFGFKRVFGTEPNKQLPIDFLNVLLPEHHRIKDLTFKNTENLGNTPIDRKAIFDIYCQAENGQRFIVEIQKVEQKFFKDRSLYYASFPIQEQAKKGKWDYKLEAVYTVGILDFIFDEHQHDEQLLHQVKLKDQKCRVFYDKLTFFYIELPKFTKTLGQLESQFEKWLFLLRHLSELSDRPELLGDSVFNQLFEVAEIANFSSIEQDNYLNSLKYYRDLNNVIDTSREKGWEKGREFGREEGRQKGVIEGQRALLLRQLSRKLGELPEAVQEQLSQLSESLLDELSEILFDLETVEELEAWLTEHVGAKHLGDNLST